MKALIWSKSDKKNSRLTEPADKQLMLNIRVIIDVVVAAVHDDDVIVIVITIIVFLFRMFRKNE